MRKVFTLIELLAVIVILAIISLISVPIVINIINDSKTESQKRSVDLYMNAVELSLAQTNMKSKIGDAIFIIQNDGNLIPESSGEMSESIEVKIQGEKLQGGLINFSNGKIVEKAT